MNGASVISRGFLCLMAGLFLTQAELHAEQRWTRFRGTDGSGHSTAGDVPVKWGAGDLVWRTELEGQGHSSPCLWDKKIFVTSARKVGDDVVRVIACLDSSSGKILWQKATPPGPAEKIHGMNNFASATCAVDGERVVAFYGKGGIYCYDLNGKELWVRHLGDFPGPWGTAASPIILGDLVIQNCDAQGASSLVALNKETGETVWETPRRSKPRGGWSTPLLVETGSTAELVVNGEHGLNGYDPRTGEQLWFCKGFSGRGTPSPVSENRIIYVISAKPGDTYALRPGGRGDVTSSHMVWHTPRPRGRNLASPVLVKNHLLTVSMEGYGYCYDATTGKQLWAEKLEGRYCASPLSAGGLVYFQNEAGKTLVVKPGSKLEIVARNDIGHRQNEKFRACQITGNGRMIARSDRAVYCIGKPAESQ